MNRNNTNFPSELYENLKLAMETSKLSDKLFYYQKLVIEYVTKLDSGMYIWHDMGLGKTILSIALAAILQSTGYLIIILTPKSLQKNYKQGIVQYNKAVGNTGIQVDENTFNFVVKSNIINKNVAKILGPTQIFSTDRTPVRINKIHQKTAFIIDEAHQISQLIVNGSEEWRAWYDTIMTSPLAKVFLLSGSLFSSSPFELVPICNLLAKEEIFPENHEQFMTAFWDRKERKMKNRGVFQNRIYGLFSRMSLTYLEAETVNFYPEAKPTEIVKCKMGKYQFESYMLARDKEVQEKRINGEVRSRPVVKKFEAVDKDSASYRVRSRQFSNFAPESTIWEIYNRPHESSEVDNLLKTMDSEYFHTTKFVETHKISAKHKGLKGLIYSQFVGIGGGGALAESYRRAGYEEYTIKSGLKSDKPRFAMVNGGLNIEDQKKITDVYDLPENDDGSIIEFLIIGLQQTTGLDPKCVCWVVMLEPYWADYIRAQLFSRAIRFKSHIRLPAEKRIAYTYIMISTYPDNVDEKILNNRSTKITTDEHLLRAMEFDAAQAKEFKDPIVEVAVECLFIKEKYPDHKCRTCAPTNKQLFTKDVNAMQSLIYDCQRSDPCDLSAKEEVKAIKVTYDESEYFAVPDDNKYGYLVYFKVGTEYEEVKPSSPIFKGILEAIKKK